MSFEEINLKRGYLAEHRYNNLISRKFGDVVVIGFAETVNKAKRVLVRCRCGNKYPITEIYLRKRKETRCQRCSQVLKNSGREGYESFLEENHWIAKKGADDSFRGLKKSIIN